MLPTTTCLIAFMMLLAAVNGQSIFGACGRPVAKSVSNLNVTAPESQDCPLNGPNDFFCHNASVMIDKDSAICFLEDLPGHTERVGVNGSVMMENSSAMFLHGAIQLQSKGSLSLADHAKVYLKNGGAAKAIIEVGNVNMSQSELTVIWNGDTNYSMSMGKLHCRGSAISFNQSQVYDLDSVLLAQSVLDSDSGFLFGIDDLSLANSVLNVTNGSHVSGQVSFALNRSLINVTGIHSELLSQKSVVLNESVMNVKSDDTWRTGVRYQNSLLLFNSTMNMHIYGNVDGQDRVFLNRSNVSLTNALIIGQTGSQLIMSDSTMVGTSLPISAIAIRIYLDSYAALTMRSAVLTIESSGADTYSCLHLDTMSFLQIIGQDEPVRVTMNDDSRLNLNNGAHCVVSKDVVVPAGAGVDWYPGYKGDGVVCNDFWGGYVAGMYNELQNVPWA